VSSLFAAQHNGEAQVGAEAERPPARLGAFCRCLGLGAGKLTRTRTKGMSLEEEKGGGLLSCPWRSSVREILIAG
jgi:hypothetical protein